MRRGSKALIAPALALVVGCGSGGSTVAKQKKQKNLLDRPVSVEALEGPVTLTSVNQRWSGARAQTRVNLPIKKGRDGQGWSSSEWLRAESQRIKMRFSVSGREHLSEVLPQKNLLAGVALVCDGWSVQNPKKGQGIQVDFRFVNYPARARAEFNTDLEHLAEVERFLRFNVMAVTRADEMLSPTATAVGSAAASATRAVAPAPSSPPPPRERGLRITRAAAEPESARPGELIVLAITYEVSSGDGSSVAVREVRVLAKGPNRLAEFEETVDRLPGTYTSRQTINVPASASAGFYSYQATVGFGELSDQYSAIFEVR